TRAEELLPEPEGATKPVTFKDLVVDFTREEWGLLGPTQRILFHDMMLRNYSNLVSLHQCFPPPFSPWTGLPDSKPDVISKLEQWEDPWTVGRDLQGDSSLAESEACPLFPSPQQRIHCVAIVPVLVQSRLGPGAPLAHTYVSGASVSRLPGTYRAKVDRK
uniref:KRAB domain-containing protein n=1 Tax=Equus asinus asinus TaxID=83772 RepID=A0A8C4MN88_EQUAS